MEITENIDWIPLGLAIKKARKAVPGLRQEVLAGKLDLKQSAVSFAENGEKGKVSQDVVKKIAEKVGVEWTQYLLHAQPAEPELKTGRCCRAEGCPGAFPVLINKGVSWNIKMRPFRFKSADEECPLCGADAWAEDQEGAGEFLDETPSGYLALLVDFSGPGTLLVKVIKEYRASLLEMAEAGRPSCA